MLTSLLEYNILAIYLKPTPQERLLEGGVTNKGLLEEGGGSHDAGGEWELHRHLHVLLLLRHHLPDGGTVALRQCHHRARHHCLHTKLLLQHLHHGRRQGECHHTVLHAWIHGARCHGRREVRRPDNDCSSSTCKKGKESEHGKHLGCL
jgi:hypothetical protein